MKKHLSVFMLMARSTIYKHLSLLVLMAAVEGGLFCWLLARGNAGGGLGLETLIRQSRIIWVFGACFVLMTVLLAMTGSEGGSKLSYTLKRLSVSERWVFVWQSAYNTVCYLLLWAAQILIAVVLCRIYEANAAAEYVSGQTVFLAFYRNNFLHALLPFEDAIFWVRNGIFAAALGLCAAWFPMAQRKGKRFAVLFVFGGGVIVLFSCGIGDAINCAAAIILSLLCVGVVLYQVLEIEVPNED